MSNLLNGNPTETPPETLSQPAGPTSLTGLVEGFTYNSSEFSVAKMKPTGQMLSVTIVGSLLGVAVGQTITVHGQWQKHNRFGDQFRVTSFATEVPKTRDGLIAYLASDLIPGLGKSKATILVDYFKEKTIQILDLEPRRITEVPGIGKKTARKIVEGWQTHRNMADLQMFLQDHGLGSGLAARIHNAYEDKALTILQQNPYMITDVRGFGFLTADKVARSLGLPDDDPFRIRSAIAHALDQAANEDGHLYLPRTKLVEAVEKLLNRWRDDVPNQNESIRVDAEAVEIQIAALQQAEGVMIDMLSTITEGGIEVEAMVALPWAYRTEIGIAQKVKRLLGNPISKIRQAFKDTDWDKALTWVQSQTGIRLAQSQAQAVHMTMNEQVAILTGGPGTGKTTTIRSILTLLGQSEARIQLAAPTGKAAKRLSESTGVEAKTIHRLLGVEGPGQFSKDENNPLKADMIIVDEMSMVDASLFYSLIKAIKPDTHLLLVGDVDQLPSVGPGDILNDLIRSGLIPTVQLDVIFRQGEESGIVPNAHRVNGGDLPIFSKVGEGSNDFFWFGIEDDHRAAEQIVDLVAEKIPNRFGISSRDIQVLSPM
ncbi:MAG: AAA family ATPase [Chloroflexota bacterium]